MDRLIPFDVEIDISTIEPLNSGYRQYLEQFTGRTWTVVGVRNTEEFLLVRKGEIAHWVYKLFCKVISEAKHE